MELLDKLASKMGTTVEYLWGVLIRQAPISAITDIIQYMLLALGCWLCFRWTIKLYNAIQKNSVDEIWYVPIVIIWLVFTVLIITAFFCFPYTIFAIINPEYWALHKVFDAIGPK